MNERPLLILDIDETLIHGRDRPLARQCDYRAGNYYIYLRPHVELFLQTVGAHYDVACWSSATPNYLKLVVDQLLEAAGTDYELIFRWDRSRCTRLYDDNRAEYYFLKDLRKLEAYGYLLKRALILEDEPRKVQKHEENAVIVQPFEGDLDDDELLLLAQYLQKISGEEDFRTVDKKFWKTSGL